MRYSVAFKNLRTGKGWVKSFTSYSSAVKAKRGIQRKTKNIGSTVAPSRGFNYGKLLKTLNKRKW